MDIHLKFSNEAKFVFIDYICLTIVFIGFPMVYPCDFVKELIT